MIAQPVWNCETLAICVEARERGRLATSHFNKLELQIDFLIANYEASIT